MKGMAIYFQTLLQIYHCGTPIVQPLFFLPDLLKVCNIQFSNGSFSEEKVQVVVPNTATQFMLNWWTLTPDRYWIVRPLLVRIDPLFIGNPN